jgi:hypothetical protein
MIRTLPVQTAASTEAVVYAIQDWLITGRELQRTADEDMPSNWWLSQKAVVLIDPEPARRTVIWPVGRPLNVSI